MKELCWEAGSAWSRGKALQRRWAALLAAVALGAALSNLISALGGQQRAARARGGQGRRYSIAGWAAARRTAHAAGGWTPPWCSVCSAFRRAACSAAARWRRSPATCWPWRPPRPARPARLAALARAAAPPHSSAWQTRARPCAAATPLPRTAPSPLMAPRAGRRGRPAEARGARRPPSAPPGSSRWAAARRARSARGLRLPRPRPGTALLAACAPCVGH